MIFKDIHDNIVRIPDDMICGVLNQEEGQATLWAVGDSDGTDSVLFEVTPDVFIDVLRALDDKEIG